MGVLHISVEVTTPRLQAYFFFSRSLGHHEGRAPVRGLLVPCGCLEGEPSKGPGEQALEGESERGWICFPEGQGYRSHHPLSDRGSRKGNLRDPT